MGSCVRPEVVTVWRTLSRKLAESLLQVQNPRLRRRRAASSSEIHPWHQCEDALFVYFATVTVIQLLIIARREVGTLLGFSCVEYIGVGIFHTLVSEETHKHSTTTVAVQ